MGASANEKAGGVDVRRVGHGSGTGRTHRHRTWTRRHRTRHRHGFTRPTRTAVSSQTRWVGWTRGCQGMNETRTLVSSRPRASLRIGHPSEQLADPVNTSSDVTAGDPRGAGSWAPSWASYVAVVETSMAEHARLEVPRVPSSRVPQHRDETSMTLASIARRSSSVVPHHRDETSMTLVSSHPSSSSSSIAIETVTEGASVGHSAACEHQRCRPLRFVSRGRVRDRENTHL